MLEKLKRFLPDSFILLLLAMIVLAWLMPGVGMGEGSFNLENITDWGITLLFFFYGLKLSPEKMRQGLGNWRMHIVIQLITFLLFPLLVIGVYPMFHGGAYEALWVGMFFLAALPSTASTSVVMVSMAGGNVPGAIFNASISGIIGILVTPLWMSIVLTSQTQNFDFSGILMQLVMQIIAPVIAGLLLHRYFAKWVERYQKQLSMLDKATILLIVYQSFSHSFITKAFANVSWGALGWLFLAVVALFFLVMKLTSFIGRLMQLNREDYITVLFCGSKKSLLHGTVMASVLFAGISGSGIYLLPIMIFHAFQLFYISLLAQKMRLQRN